MKKIFKSKRWIAFFLALLLIVTTCINSSDVFLWATGEDETSVSEQTDSGPAEDIVEMEVEEAEEETDSSETTEEADTEETGTDETGTDEAVAEETDGGETQDSTQDAEQEAGENEGQVPEETEVPEDGITEDGITEDEITEEVPEIVEEAVTYGYAVYYYYDGVEDKGARVEKEGALGDSIFTFDAEKEVEHNGNNYVLDKVENKDGKVTEDAGKNVVKVYYVLKKEEVAKPAQTLTARASDGAKVTVEAPEGALPEGSKVTISVVKDSEVLKKFKEAAEVEGKTLTDIKLYDVTIWDAEGKEIQPDNSVTVTISNTGLEGDDASVFHADDEKAPVKKVADIDDANNASFEAEHFSVKAIAVYAERDVKEYYKTYNKEDKPHLNDYESVEGGFKSGNYEWRSSDNSIVNILSDNNANSTIVDCLENGNADVSLYKDNKEVAIFHITVGTVTVTNPVYVYVKLDGMQGSNGKLSEETLKKLEALGLSVNDHGWCTVGWIGDIPIDIPEQGVAGTKEESYGRMVTDATEKAVLDAIQSGKLVRYGTHKVVLDDVIWFPEREDDDFGLLVADGADDYVKEGTNVWHLNGYLDVSKISYTIKYVDKENNEEIAESVTREVEWTEIGNEIEISRNDIKTISGYTYVESSPSGEKLKIGLDDNVITLYYERPALKTKIFKTAERETAKAGDKIKYSIEVENTSSGRDLENVVILDKMTNASGEIQDVEGATYEYDKETKTYTFTIEKIPPAISGQQVHRVTITYNYVVPNADMGKTIINTVALSNSEIKLEDDSKLTAEVAIEKGVLTVKAGNPESVYDGTVQTVENFFVNEAGQKLEQPEKIQVTYGSEEYYVTGVTAKAKGKDAGTYSNVIECTNAKVFDKDGEEVTKRFTVVGEDGTFTIQKKDVTLVSASLEKEYDGTPLNNGSAGSEGVVVFCKDGDNKENVKLLSNGLVREDGWVEGEGATYNFTGSVLYANSFTENDFTCNPKQGTDLNNYNIIKVLGGLSITNRNAKYKVELVTNSGNFDYDGEEHTVTGFVGEIEHDGEKVIEIKKNRETFYISGLQASGSGVTVADKEYGGYPVIESGTAVVKDKDGKDVSEQFEITVKRGLVTINEREITITAGSASYKYTGEEYKASDMEKPADIIGRPLVAGHNYEVEVEGSQTLVGECTTEIIDGSIKITDKDNNDVTSNYKFNYETGKIIVTDDEVDNELVIKKDANGTEGYEVGEVVEFTISVTNIFDEEKTIVLTELPKVSFDKMDDLDAANWLVRTWHRIMDAVAPANEKRITVGAGETVEITAFYRITQDDILAGKFINKVTVTLNDKTYDAEKEVETTDPNGYIEITKTVADIRDANGSSIPKGEKPNLNDTIEYNIEIENKGNLVMKNVVLTDELPVTFKSNDLDGGRIENGRIVFDELGIKGHKKISVSYKVTEADILKGYVKNVATATAEQPDGTPDPEIKPGEVETQTAEPKAHITLTKRVQDPKAEYALNAEVEFVIEATNDGTVTVEDLVIEDERTGNTVENGKAFTIKKIEPGESVTVGTVTYTVTEEDIKDPQSKMVNIVTGEGKTGVLYPDKNEEIPVIVEPGKAEITIEKDRPSLSIIKTADMTSDVKPGDVITYTITVTNNGNVTINNVMAEDALLGKTGTNALIYQGTLAPGESKTFTETYTVTEKDILAGKVVNTATVKGENSAGGDDPEDETVVETPAAEIVVNYMVEKFVEGPEDEPQAEYKVGETIPYLIMVKNLGNVTLENVVVSDQLSNAAGEVTFTRVNDRPIEDQDSLAPGTRVTLNDDNTVTIAAIAPGEEVRLNCEYTVTRADAGNTIQNKAVVTADPVKPDDGDPIDPGSEETPEVPVNVESIYNLTIHYVYADGTMAAADYTGQYLAGEMYGPIYSPTVNGYISSTPFISSSEKGMPASDVELTVIYLAQTTPGGGGDGGDDTPDTPPAPDTPDTPPTLPVNPNPAITIPPTPVPAGGTPVVTVGGPALAALDDEAVPLGALIDVDEDGNVTVTPISEEEIPLASGSNDDHKCCILHFLLMLAALIIYTWYTHSMKKHQKKLAEMKDELAEETLKKQLGITDGRQAEM